MVEATTVTVATATEFDANETTALLTITFSNTAAFTPGASTNYYYTVTLTEQGKTDTEFTFKKVGEGTEIAAATETSFVVDNATLNFTSAATAKSDTAKIYYSK